MAETGMETAVLAHKAVLHVPMKTWTGSRMEDIEGIGAAVDALLLKLGEAGLRNMYASKATGYYGGRQYAETMFTVFGGQPEIEAAVRTFVEWQALCRDVLRQESFAYETDGTMRVCRFADGM